MWELHYSQWADVYPQKRAVQIEHCDSAFYIDYTSHGRLNKIRMGLSKLRNTSQNLYPSMKTQG